MGNTHSSKRKGKSFKHVKDLEKIGRNETGIQCSLLIPPNQSKPQYCSKRIQADPNYLPEIQSRSTSFNIEKEMVEKNKGFDQRCSFVQGQMPYFASQASVYVANVNSGNFDLTRVRKAPSRWIYPATNKGDSRIIPADDFIWQAPSAYWGDIDPSFNVLVRQKSKSWHDCLNRNLNNSSGRQRC